MNNLADIRAVVFDAYGTLVSIGNRRWPYRRLLDRLRLKGQPDSVDAATRVMTVDASLPEMVRVLGAQLGEQDLAELQRDLAAELASVRCFGDTLPALQVLRAAGLRVGLCSNLATPYAEPIRRLLPNLDVYGWSFELGATKPDPRIYRHVCQALDVAPDQAVMVGDTHLADVEGPRRIGMRALHLVRDPTRMSPEPNPLRSLANLLPKIIPAPGNAESA